MGRMVELTGDQIGIELCLGLIYCLIPVKSLNFDLSVVSILATQTDRTFTLSSFSF